MIWIVLGILALMFFIKEQKDSLDQRLDEIEHRLSKFSDDDLYNSESQETTD